MSILFLSLLDLSFISLSDVSIKDLSISTNKTSNFTALMNLSLTICFCDICFNISPHLLDWLINKSRSFECFDFSPISFLNSLATTVIVAKGVPKEWAAAAACPPNDSSSYSFAITCCNWFNAWDLFFVSPANLIPK